MKKNSIIFLLSVFLFSLAISAEARTMYAPDGRTAWVEEGTEYTWQNAGWYLEPVTIMYAPDGRQIVVESSKVYDWKNVGWYDYPVTVMYAPDGREIVISSDTVVAYQQVGWYTQPVQMLYASDGRSQVFAKTQVDKLLTLGWYALPYSKARNESIKMAYKSLLINNYHDYKTNYGMTYGYWYCIYDIDKDGIPELIVDEEGSAGSTLSYVYTYNTNTEQIDYVGCAYLGHSSHASYPGANGMLRVGGQMGHFWLDLITLSYGWLSETNIDDLYIRYGDYPESSDYFEGSFNLESCRANDYSLLNKML